jgi:hypothetical protein
MCHFDHGNKIYTIPLCPAQNESMLCQSYLSVKTTPRHRYAVTIMATRMTVEVWLCVFI